MPDQDPLVGRTLALNIEKANKFSTYGFFVNPKVYMSVVPRKAEFHSIRRALEEGVLIDVTDNTKAIQAPSGTGSSLLPVKEIDSDPTKVVYFLQETDDNGVTAMVMVSPSSAEEAADWAEQLRATKTIKRKRQIEGELISV